MAKPTQAEIDKALAEYEALATDYRNALDVANAIKYRRDRAIDKHIALLNQR
jgi:uncharacterized protein (DUF433 family)